MNSLRYLPSLLVLSLPGFAYSADEAVDFNRHIKPIFESACTHCHGEKKQEGDLAMHTLEAILTAEDGPGLVAGEPENSPVYTTTIHEAGHDDIMPPKKDGPPLSKEQTEKIKEWIKAGAKWPDGVVLKEVPRMQFERDIQPILEMQCVSCHKPDKMKGDLDLTTREAAMTGGENGPALVPFDVSKSSIHSTIILPADDEDLMPPAKSGGPLSKVEIEKIKLWIEQGAPWTEGVVLKQRPKDEVRPPSPDNLALVQKIREKILATQKEQSEADMKNYAATGPKLPKPYGMVPIKGGEFLMGSPDSEAGRKDDEGPQVKVKVSPFWMGSHEVPWDLYMPFMITSESRYKDGAKKQPKPTDTEVDAVSSPTTPYTDMTFGLGQDGYPAISMTEHAASKFCQWLSAQTGHFYRLPTEAEWEYAARAGTTTAYFFGDDAATLDEYAWFADNSDPEGTGRNSTHPIGKKKPNPWGLYDIYGNVNEWVLDQHDSGWYAKLAAAGLAENPFNRPVTLYPRVARGGGFKSAADKCRSAVRRASTESWKQQDPQLPKSIWYHTDAQFLGFRIVRPLQVPSAEEMHYYWNCGTIDKQ